MRCFPTLLAVLSLAHATYTKRVRHTLAANATKTEAVRGLPRATPAVREHYHTGVGNMGLATMGLNDMGSVNARLGHQLGNRTDIGQGGLFQPPSGENRWQDLRGGSAEVQIAQAGGPGTVASAVDHKGTDDMRPDVVYLHLFKPVPHVYNICPFAIKIESFLRLHNVPYEAVYTRKMSSKGQMPYIKRNLAGEVIEVPDSNVVLSYLRSEYAIDEGLSPAERAVSHATVRMIEEHTAQIGFYYRYGLHAEDFLRSLDVRTRMLGGDTAMEEKFARIQSEITKNKMMARGLGKHSDEELWGFSHDDLRAVSDYLGEKQYFFGERATTIDCVLFGHLVQFLYIPIDFPQKHFITEECPNLVRFVERFREAYWKDWEEKSSIGAAAVADPAVGQMASD